MSAVSGACASGEMAWLSAAHTLLGIIACMHVPPAPQFKDRTVSRTYVAVALGVPRPPEGRVATNIGR